MITDRRAIVVVVGMGIFFAAVGVHRWPRLFSRQKEVVPMETAVEASASASPTVSPSATPKPLTLAQMNAKFGPCAVVPTLMYHHIEDDESAQAAGHAWMSVSPETFRAQMQYLRDHGYAPVRVEQVGQFFDQGVALPAKPVVLSFDDGYADFAANAAAILAEFAYPAVLFLPTGLVENPNYVTWDQVGQLGGAGVYIGNHTWSHKSLTSTRELAEKEIGLADDQLTQHGLNAAKVFAYPYGDERETAKNVLVEKGYTLAFTTQPGRILCKGQRWELPRVRIGKGWLANYGF